MNQAEKDEGLLEALVDRINEQRLPRLLALQKQVYENKALDNYDLEFLKMAIHDANIIQPLIERHPEYQKLTMEIIALYNDILKRDLKVEQSNQSAFLK